jgi:excisionase family DNA binding protein
MMEIFTVKEAAKLLKTDIRTVYELIKTGALKAKKVGNYKITSTEIERFLSEE